ncbi:hypothetical protein Tco_1515011 [Tanacetum coccineum]
MAVVVEVRKTLPLLVMNRVSSSSTTISFYTSSVTASPLEEGGDHTDSVTGPSLRSVVASVRFVVLSDSSHHSATNSAGPEGDSFVRSIVPVTNEATTVTTVVAIPADVVKDKSWFCCREYSCEEVTDAGLEEIYVPEWTVTKGFELNDGRSCANMIDHFTPPAFFKTVRGMEHEQLFAEFNVSAARNLSLSSEVRMRAEYNILEKRKWRSLAEEKDSLLGAKDKEIEELRSQLLKAKEESVVVAQLRARVSSLEAIEGSLRGEVASVKGYNDLLEQERNVLRLQVTNLESTVAEKDRELSDLEISSSSLRSQNQGLVSQVHELETSSARLREQLDLYEGNMKRLEEFQDNLMRPLETRTEMVITHEISFYGYVSQFVLNIWRLAENVLARGYRDGMQECLAAGIELLDKAGRSFMNLDSLAFPTQDVFVSLDHPLSSEALIEPPIVVPATNALSTVVIVPHSGPSVSVEDYENPDLVDVVPKNVTLGPEGEENIDASTGGDPAFSRLENEARDVLGSSLPLRSFNLYDPFPSASVTSYGPFHLGPNFPVSSTRLALLLWYTKSPGLKLAFLTFSKLISNASSFLATSTSVVLNVAFNFAGDDSSVPLVNENGVTALSLLDADDFILRVAYNDLSSSTVLQAFYLICRGMPCPLVAREGFLLLGFKEAYALEEGRGTGIFIYVLGFLMESFNKLGLVIRARIPEILCIPGAPLTILLYGWYLCMSFVDSYSLLDVSLGKMLENSGWVWESTVSLGDLRLLIQSIRLLRLVNSSRSTGSSLEEPEGVEGRSSIAPTDGRQLVSGTLVGKGSVIIVIAAANYLPRTLVNPLQCIAEAE